MKATPVLPVDWQAVARITAGAALPEAEDLIKAVPLTEEARGRLIATATTLCQARTGRFVATLARELSLKRDDPGVAWLARTFGDGPTASDKQWGHLLLSYAVPELEQRVGEAGVDDLTAAGLRREIRRWVEDTRAVASRSLELENELNGDSWGPGMPNYMVLADWVSWRLLRRVLDALGDGLGPEGLTQLLTSALDAIRFAAPDTEVSGFSRLVTSS